VEAELKVVAEPGLFGGHTFAAPLCTSANMSGDPNGSITEWDRAYEFAVDRRVPLVVRCDSTQELLGSYPIFWLQRERVRIDRVGPGMEEIKAALPARLFADSAA
jgi:tRNA A37 threonylcarbamoyladenosine synthetase subunit TsaC/SUA5/YrdC